MRLQIALALVISLGIFSCKKTERFTLLPAQQSGISFENTITINDTLNALAFEYVYNGGGVGMGDFNNDGFVDVYLTGNQVSNKLYLNKGANEGNLNFDDITTQSNTSGQGKWCEGVAVVDINNDSLLDIYVCASVKKGKENLANILYVNQGVDKNGIPVFKDMAQQYGLADTTHTTQAAFFDYDNDGDLDVYLLVNEMERVRFPNKYVKKQNDGTSRRTDRLYRNDGPVDKPGGGFKNVSKEANITLEGYGLGINICDINQDGWKDIYVANDYLSNDIFYINNKNGTFTDKAFSYFKHTSYSAMGCDIQDLNNDGLADIFTVDMMPADNYRKKMMIPANNYFTYQNNEIYEYIYQYTRNTLQANRGMIPGTNEPIFSEIGIQAGLATTDWSWGPMLADFDNDGLKDIIITNGYPKDVTDQDFVAYRHGANGQFTLKQLYDSIPEVKKENYAFKNLGDFRFEDVSKQWNIGPASFSNGAAYADLDNDGDLDYITNNINQPAFVFVNNTIQDFAENSNYLKIKLVGDGSNSAGIGAKIKLNYGNNEVQTFEYTPYRGYLSSIYDNIHFGLGIATAVSSVEVTWPSGAFTQLNDIKANQVITIKEQGQNTLSPGLVKPSPFILVENTHLITYTDKEKDFIDFNYEKLLPHKLSEYGPALAMADINGDGLQDVFVGGSSGYLGKFLLQNNNGNYTESQRLVGETDQTKLAEDAGALFFDADRDGDQDLYLVSGGNEYFAGHVSYQDRLYINDGKGNFTQNIAALPGLLKSGSCVKAADFDHDGDLDLFVGGRSQPQSYPSPVASYIFRNDSKKDQPKFIEISGNIAPILKNIGMVTDALWTDYDQDTWPDLLLVGEAMPITLLKNSNGKRFEKVSLGAVDKEIGLWSSLVAGDFDGDNDTDYIIGNAGQNNLLKPYNGFPLTLYGKDFNQDGMYDAIPTIYSKNTEGKMTEVTYHGRDDLIKQMNIIKQKYTNYKSFANTDIHKILWEGDMVNAQKLQINNTNTSVLENKGDGTFTLAALPWQAQVGPVFGILAQDFDGDGNLDLLMVGNDFGNEVSVGRLDAHHGLLMKGTGSMGFIPVLSQNSGFYVPGNAKALALTSNATFGTTILASQNRGALKCFNFDSAHQSVNFTENDQYITVKLGNGKTLRYENYLGHSFYSQSSPMVILPKNTVSVTGFNQNKVQRNINFK